MLRSRSHRREELSRFGPCNWQVRELPVQHADWSGRNGPRVNATFHQAGILNPVAYYGMAEWKKRILEAGFLSLHHHRKTHAELLKKAGQPGKPYSIANPESRSGATD